MAPRWRRVLPWAVASAIACIGCNKKEDPTGAGLGPIGGDRAKRAPSRVETLELDDLGAQPGMLTDGAVFAAVQAGAAQAFLHQIPLPEEITRELAEARRALGFDVLTDDVLARFAIAPDAVVSFSVRPVGVESGKALAKGIRDRDDRFLGLVGRVLQEPPRELALEMGTPPPVEAPKPLETPPPVPTEEAVPPPVPAKPIVFAPPAAVPPPTEPAIPSIEVTPSEPTVEIPMATPVPPGTPPLEPPPPPASIDPAERREIDELLRHADAMALQFRVHVPTEDPSKILGELRVRVDQRMLRRGEAICRGLTVELCVTDGGDVLLVRRDGDAVVFDMVAFFGRYHETADPEARRRSLTEAIEAPRAELPALAKMAGHASAYLHAPAIMDLFEHERAGQALRELDWSSSPAEAVRRRFDQADRLRRMLDAPRLFDGVLASVHHERDRTQLQITWPLREDQAELARGALVPPPLLVPVPTLAALCDGALACARSRGLPSPSELGTKLALGIYGDADQLEDAIDASEEAATLVLLASTWPNALGTLLWHVPLAEARGPEAAMVRGLIDAVARVQGLGLSVRRIELGGRALAGEYAAYARVPVNDIGLVRTLLAMAEQRLVPTTVEGVEGAISMLRIPEDDVPAVLVAREDPTTIEIEGEEVRYGWLTVADGTERFAWLLGQPTDDGQEPLLYGEIPDLWRLVATMPEPAAELGFARTWASERALRAALHVDEGQPHLLFDLALHQGAAADGTR